MQCMKYLNKKIIFFGVLRISIQNNLFFHVKALKDLLFVFNQVTQYFFSFSLSLIVNKLIITLEFYLKQNNDSPNPTEHYLYFLN